MVNIFFGPDKRAYNAAKRQAKFYLPQQAAAATAYLLPFRSTQGIKKNLVYCGTSCTAAAPQ